MERETVVVKGTTLPKSYELDKFYEFPVRDGDVWICGFPKSGTTWTQEMVWMIMHNLDFEGAKEDIHIRVPFAELSWAAPHDENSPHHARDTLGFIKKEYEKGPVCLKTHLPWQLLPRDIQEGLKKPKIIYVMRNAKDQIVSMYHWNKMLYGYNEPLEKFFEGYLKNEYVYTPYWGHVFGFWKQRSKPNVMFLRYEEMSKDLPGMIRKVANFVERPMSDEKVAKLVKHLSFDTMRKNPAVNNENLIEKCRKDRGLEKSETNHMRQGKTGSHKTEMPPELIEKVERWIEDNTKGTDFVFW
ncbi:unnamed protein product [Acanthoscelides obtectus]|uniref:Sulfotransferase domain-containing protein n=1 Tax=Acanthoscelides obtectus TaxID=200917 RepID=A0A9P0PBW8_ACAOB|nr:unnamed protein product [Acanthoscelides obtectus]CAK1665429.1 Amine sulfotransferase [Acanthoscelides obtectus]